VLNKIRKVLNKIRTVQTLCKEECMHGTVHANGGRFVTIL